MTFVKTTWVDDAAPGLSAAQLNRIEQGIGDLHDRRIRADVSAITSYTFSSLDGNTDGVYEIVAHGYIIHTGGSDAGLRVQPNADSGGNYAGQAWRTYWDAGLVTNIVDQNNEAGTASVAAGALLCVMNWGGNGPVYGRLSIAARDDSGGAQQVKAFSGEYSSRPVGTGDNKNMKGVVGGYWNGPNITSLKIVVPDGTFTGRLILNKIGLA